LRIVAAGNPAGAEEPTRRNSRVMMELLARQKQQLQQQQASSVRVTHQHVWCAERSPACHTRKSSFRRPTLLITMFAGGTAAAGRCFGAASTAGPGRPHSHCKHRVCHPSRLQVSSSTNPHHQAVSWCSARSAVHVLCVRLARLLNLLYT
jgi:hypothetical protein